jgi:hypothetical protein
MDRHESCLTDIQKQQLYTCVSIGCDRAAACEVAGCTAQQLQQELELGPEFAEQLLRHEGGAEVLRMRTVHDALADAKNWRAAAWWLEQKAKKRLSRRNARQVSTVELQQYLGELIDLIVSEVRTEEDRERVLARLAEMANAIEADLPVEDDQCS